MKEGTPCRLILYRTCLQPSLKSCCHKQLSKLRIGLNSPPLVEDPDRFYRSGERKISRLASVHPLIVFLKMGTLRRFQSRNEGFCPRSRKSRDCAEAYSGMPPKRSCRLTPRLGKKTIYGWKLTKPCALMNPPGIIKRLCSFSFTKKKTNPKKSPLRRDPSGCQVLLESGGRWGTRPPTADSDSHSAYSSVSAMLGAPPRGRSKPLRWSAL